MKTLKILTALVALLAGLESAKAQTLITNIGCVEFSWQGDIPSADIHALSIYHTTNYTAPVWPNFTGWQKIGGTTNGALTNINLNVTVGPHFFFLVASNAWGNGLPSNVVGTSNAPPTVLNFKIISQTALPCP